MTKEDINIRDPFVLFENGKYYLYGTRGGGFGMHTGGFDVYVSEDLLHFSDPIECFNSRKHSLDRVEARSRRSSPHSSSYASSFLEIRIKTKNASLGMRFLFVTPLCQSLSPGCGVFKSKRIFICSGGFRPFLQADNRYSYCSSERAL